MDYLYTLPTTGAFFFPSCLSVSNGPDLLTAASDHRAQLRDLLKKLKRSDQKDIVSVIRIVENYLPFLFAIHKSRIIALDGFILDNDSIEERTEADIESEISLIQLKPLVFSWRATFLDHKVPGKAFPRLDVHGLASEVSFILFTYAFALCNYAQSMSGQRVTELLCKAAGIFEYQNRHLAPILSQTTQHRSCPELFSEFSAALKNICLGNAQMNALKLLESKASNAISCRVAVGASDQFSTAIGLLSSHPMIKNIPTEFKEALHKAQSYALSRAYLYLGQEQEGLGQVGFAIGCAQQAEALHKDEQSALLLNRWLKDNRQVSFQTVVSKAEVQTKLPSGREFVKATAYIPQISGRAAKTTAAQYSNSQGYY